MSLGRQGRAPRNKRWGSARSLSLPLGALNLGHINNFDEVDIITSQTAARNVETRTLSACVPSHPSLLPIYSVFYLSTYHIISKLKLMLK